MERLDQLIAPLMFSDLHLGFWMGFNLKKANFRVDQTDMMGFSETGEFFTQNQ